MKFINYTVSLLILIFAISGCSSVKVIDSNVQQKYLDETYGKDTLIKADFLSEDLFNQGIALQKQSNFVNSKLPAGPGKQKTESKKINEQKWIKNQFLYFMLQPSNLQSEGSLKLSVKLIDKSGESIAESVENSKVNVQYSGGYNIYIYTWTVKALKPVTQENYGSLAPIKLIVEFPNGEKTVYSVLN